jgi:DNA-binding NarL/FixJ family response regulator
MKYHSDILELMKADARLCNEAARQAQGIRGLEGMQTAGPLQLTEGEPATGFRSTPLSEQEKKDIIHYIKKGWSTKSIAVFVGVSKATVSRYRNNLK